MIVNVTSATGIVRTGLIDKDSGVIEFPDGEITHVLYEKNLNKTIFVVKNEKPIKEIKEVIPASTEQSVKGLAPKSKRK